MDAWALVVSVAILLASVLAVSRVKRRRAATARWKSRESVFQQARLSLDPILHRGRPRYIQTAVVPTLVGLLVGGVVVLGTYLAYWHGYSQIWLLLLGVVLVAAGLKLRRSRLALHDDETERD
jgi:ABC-type iron transport system FetAB permease component